jgi:hypothetical protein
MSRFAKLAIVLSSCTAAQPAPIAAPALATPVAEVEVPLAKPEPAKPDEVARPVATPAPVEPVVEQPVEPAVAEPVAPAVVTSEAVPSTKPRPRLPTARPMDPEDEDVQLMTRAGPKWVKVEKKPKPRVTKKPVAGTK